MPGEDTGTLPQLFGEWSEDEKTIVPVGAVVPMVVGVTTAVKVTASVATLIGREEDTVMVVPVTVTVWLALAEVDPLKLLSPLYVAVMVCTPAVPRDATQEGTVELVASVDVQSGTGVPEVVSEKVTVPLGSVKPVSVTRDVTAALKVTG